MTKLRARRALIPIMAATALAAALPSALGGDVANGATPPAAPTVDVRVETEDWTTLLQRVQPTTEPVNMVAGSDYTQPGGYYGGSHTCTGQNNLNPNGYADVGPTPVTALVAATRQEGVSWYAPFDYEADDFSRIYRIGYDMVDGPAGPYFSIHVNGQDVTGRGCQVQLNDGDEVVFARGGAGKRVLHVKGPPVAYVGENATFTVTDEATGEPVKGAKVGPALTDDKGRARFEFELPGNQQLRAEMPTGDAIRSAATAICVDYRIDPKCKAADGKPVLPPAAPIQDDTAPGEPPAQAPAPCITNGQDGRCGTHDLTAPQARITDAVAEQVYKVGETPLVFSGTVGVPYGSRDRLEAESLKMVKARLTRTYRGRCWYYSPSSKSLRKMKKCGAKYARFFKVGVDSDWRLELPGRLPRGRYVLDINAVDLRGNRDWPAPRLKGRKVTNKARRGENRFVFHVTDGELPSPANKAKASRKAKASKKRR